ncbi:acyl-CoA thioesterase [Sandarakinorhabdus rubra]|uniref:acyl-CoA thioesterase n=1 Tax=Sandarakinorhabdus rubra TaxID=2672568 RepID=UPI0013DC9D44|nr:acyl-CoA thioesterase [Sandarakinorhabdus rubra]
MPPPADRAAFTMTVTAQPADIDALGHVNNAVYVVWIQQVATAHWESVASPEQQAAHLWVITRHEIDYLKETVLGEALTLTTWVGTPKGARFDRFVEICGADGRPRVKAVTTWALIDRESGRLARVRGDMAALFMPPAAG